VGYCVTDEKILIKERKHRKIAELPSAGKADIGGPFQLVDHHGKQHTNKDFLGHWLLIYFGYTFCPHVCPEILEKLGVILNQLSEL